MTQITKALFGCVATMAIAVTVGDSTAFAREAFHPDGRSVGSLAIDPTQPSVIYAGSGVGVFKTTDGGATWSNTSDGLGTPVVLDVVLDPTRSRTVYAATEAGVFKSIDGADTWTMRFSRHDVVRLAVHPSNPKVLYAGAKNAVFKSRDGGATWRRVLSFRHGQWALALAIDPHAPSTVYAGTGVGVFKTSDGGRHWRPTDRGLPKPSTRDRLEGFVRAIAIDPTHTRTVYLGTERGFFRSTNGGESWTAPAGYAAPAAGWALAIHPRNPHTLYLGSYEGVFESTKRGKDWRERSNGLVRRSAAEQPWIEAIAIDPSSPRTIYAGGNGGVFKSVDGGGHWRRASPFGAPNQRVIAEHCAATRGRCERVIDVEKVVYFELTLATRRFRTYALCVRRTAPDDGGREICVFYPVKRRLGSWGSFVRYTDQFPQLGRGTYVVTWKRLNGLQPGAPLGPALRFQLPLR